MNVNEIMAQKNITLPEPPPKGGVYAPCKISGNMAYVSGCGCIIGDIVAAGKLGRDYTLEQGQQFARNCMLNVLAVLKRELGDLARVRSVVKLLVFVASDDEFYQQPQVANGASELLGELFGQEIGIPARSAIGVNVLPGNLPVEIEAIFEFE
ncbi:MAG: RidA family protein [Candidatus Fimadaptatus sp.]|jgi:enamine deaminase RidA (YjgF/YER057c/UK114 family)